jgi:catechol 2,3-dioxygenase-like lactoylglutathione lyase family enzyme
MRVRGLTWVGTKTSNYDAMRMFFRDVLGLPIHLEQPDFTDFELPNGDTIELFGPGDQETDHFTTGPVVGFFVDDIDEARAELEASGTVQFFGETVKADDGWSWAHFTAPDGHIYELTSGPHKTLG